METEDKRMEASGGAVRQEAATVCDSDAVLRELDNNLDERMRNFRESERLSEADFAIRINVWD